MQEGERGSGFAGQRAKCVLGFLRQSHDSSPWLGAHLCSQSNVSYCPPPSCTGIFQQILWQSLSARSKAGARLLPAWEAAWFLLQHCVAPPVLRELSSALIILFLREDTTLFFMFIIIGSFALFLLSQTEFVTRLIIKSISCLGERKPSNEQATAARRDVF